MIEEEEEIKIQSPCTSAFSPSYQQRASIAQNQSLTKNQSSIDSNKNNNKMIFSEQNNNSISKNNCIDSTFKSNLNRHDDFNNINHQQLLQDNQNYFKQKYYFQSQNITEQSQMEQETFESTQNNQEEMILNSYLNEIKTEQKQQLVQQQRDHCLVQQKQLLFIEDTDSAQQPYPTLQKKQIQPCCTNQNNDLCKNIFFLYSDDEKTQLEALKYFETNIKSYSTNDLLRLFNHKFLDILIDKSKKFKQEQKIAAMSLKVLFSISMNKAQQLQFNNKNIFFDKLLALEFLQVLKDFKQETKGDSSGRCCLTQKITELNLSLAKYKIQTEQSNPSLKKNSACFFSCLFK